MKNYKNEKSLFVALLGCTICLMFTLMYLGGFKSLTYFLGSEAIYDFPETDMIKNAKGWEYHEEENGYYIVKNNAVNKYRVDRYVFFCYQHVSGITKSTYRIASTNAFRCSYVK